MAPAPEDGHQWLAFLSCLVCLFGAADEVVRLYYDGTALTARLAAWSTQRLVEYDLPYLSCLVYYIPSTDLPSHPGGLVTGSMWRVLNLLLLLLIAVSEFPNNYFPKLFDTFLRPFGTQVGTWFSGFLTITIAAGILSTPLGVVGNSATLTVRAVAGWMLLVDGVINLFFGMVYKKSIKVLRHQASHVNPAPHAKIQLANSWSAFKVTFGVIRLEHLTVGPLAAAIANMEDVVGKIIA